MFLYDLLTPHWGLNLGGLFFWSVLQIHSFTIINCQVEEHMAHKALLIKQLCFIDRGIPAWQFVDMKAHHAFE